MQTLAEMRRTTGMLLPVWYPDSVPIQEMEDILAPCLVDAGAFVEPENVIVVVDGSKPAYEAVLRARAKLGNFQALFQDENQGKGGAVVSGIQQLLKNPELEFFLARDHDNDHLVNDALNLVDLAAKMRQDTGSDFVLSIGRRVSIHRHLGFARGEFEWFMNEVVWEAVKFALARRNETVNAQYFAAYELVPDMQTGFKCYTRAVAQLLLDAIRRAPVLTPGLDVRRHGAEIPVIVETLLRGGIIGEVTRMAWENQPLTTYDLAGRVQVKGTVLAWTLRRTEVPLGVARQLLQNAIARRILGKEEQGLKELLSLSNWTLENLSGFRGEEFQPIANVQGPHYF